MKSLVPFHRSVLLDCFHDPIYLAFDRTTLHYDGVILQKRDTAKKPPPQLSWSGLFA